MSDKRSERPARMAEDWSREEVEATVADYFAMLKKEIAREPFNKAEHNRALQRMLNGRSTGAIEFKHANVSAILIELGYPYIDGYKPRSNYQDLLRDVVAARLASDLTLQAATGEAVRAPSLQEPDLQDLLAAIVPPPVREVDNSRVSERQTPRAALRLGVNYLEQEARNASLGAAGEAFVLKLEHMRLWKAGAPRLADRVEHVARTQGDGLGFDILSYEADGRERMIEVKTTRFGAMTPFFASRNEVEVSEAWAARYRLYRVFKFEDKPRVFILPGSLHRSVILDPIAYRATLP